MPVVSSSLIRRDPYRVPRAEKSPRRVPAEKAQQPSAGARTAIPPDAAAEAISRIKEPAEMGDVTQIKSIAEELKPKSDALAPICDRFIQLAEDFDFEGIAKLVGELEKIAKSG